MNSVRPEAARFIARWDGDAAVPSIERRIGDGRKLGPGDACAWVARSIAWRAMRLGVVIALQLGSGIAALAVFHHDLIAGPFSCFGR